MHVFLFYFGALLSFFLHFLLLVAGKDNKMCLNTEKIDLDQQMACRAHIHWWKYTTIMKNLNYTGQIKTRRALLISEPPPPPSFTTTTDTLFVLSGPVSTQFQNKLSRKSGIDKS